jgi:hypothetical protein
MNLVAVPRTGACKLLTGINEWRAPGPAGTLLSSHHNASSVALAQRPAAEREDDDAGRRRDREKEQTPICPDRGHPVGDR